MVFYETSLTFVLTRLYVVALQTLLYKYLCVRNLGYWNISVLKASRNSFCFLKYRSLHSLCDTLLPWFSRVESWNWPHRFGLWYVALAIFRDEGRSGPLCCLAVLRKTWWMFLRKLNLLFRVGRQDNEGSIKRLYGTVETGLIGINICGSVHHA